MIVLLHLYQWGEHAGRVFVFKKDKCQQRELTQQALDYWITIMSLKLEVVRVAMESCTEGKIVTIMYQKPLTGEKT